MRVTALFLLLLVGLVGCTPTGLGPACETHAECGPYEGCLAGHCVDATCRSNVDCAFGERCDELTCVVGCVSGADCHAGQDCVEGTCQASLCANTRLDCQAGETCVEGSCELVDRLCETCSVGSCSGSSLCVDLGNGGVCLPRCRTNAGCPAAFTCVPLESEDTRVCASDCGWLKSKGWL